MAETEGFEPIKGGVKNLELRESEDLPDISELDIGYLSLCRRVETKNPIFCANPVCKAELPNCRYYTVKNIRSNDQVADFACTECDYLFQPFGNISKYNSKPLSHDVSKLVCTRKVGDQECGEFCQPEFPGCKKYKVSDVTRVFNQGSELESAKFLCLEAKPGHAIEQTITRASTLPNLPKAIAIKLFQTEPIACSDIKCRHILPHCTQFTAVNYDSSTSTYSCIKCIDGYKPKPQPTYGYDYFSMWYNQKSINVCDLQEVSEQICDIHCKEELPACEFFSTFRIQPKSPDSQTASFSCNQCSAGYEIVESLDPVEVHHGWTISDNIKIRCRPIVVKDPQPCDDKCRNKLVHCKSYKATYSEEIGSEYLDYQCVDCDDSFESYQNPDLVPWFLAKERLVCRPKTTDTANPCDDNCKKTFPGCDEINVISNFRATGRRAYQCTKCASGWNKIPYDDTESGVIFDQYHPLFRANTILLCSEKPNQLYIDRQECPSDGSNLDSAECYYAQNCRILVKTMDLVTGEAGWICKECQAGFVPKASLPEKYAIDQSLCQAASINGNSTRLVLNARLFKS